MSSPLILTPWEYWFLKKSLFEATLKFPKEPDDGFEHYQVMVDDFIQLDCNFDIHLGCDYSSMSEPREGLNKYKLDTVMLS